MIHVMKVSGFRRQSAILLLGLVALSTLMPARGASASYLQIVPASLTLMPGQSETVSVNFSSTTNFTLAGVDLAIAFDSTRFSVSNVQLGSLNSAASGFDQTVDFPVSGELVTSSNSLGTGNPVTAGTLGSVETFTLTALGNAPTGFGSINLQKNSGNTTTAVFDQNSSAIPLFPVPTNGFDTGIDARVLISPAVPEPSSLALAGLGSLGFLGYARRRRAA